MKTLCIVLCCLTLIGCDSLRQTESDSSEPRRQSTRVTEEETAALFQDIDPQTETDPEKIRLRKLADKLGAEMGRMKSAQDKTSTDAQRLERLSPAERARYVRLKRAANALAPLERKLGEPKFGEWRSVWTEKPQSLLRYAAGIHMGVEKKRTKLYVLPIGDFTQAQKKALSKLPLFMKNFFCLQTEMLPTLPFTVIPSSKRRMHPKEKHMQFLAPYIIDHVIHPQLPDDAVGCLGITSRDLYPGEAYDFMFGQSGLFSRASVCSVFRFGNPGESPEAEHLFLTRLFKVAAHETSHMFSLRHEPNLYCLMNGRAILKEMDEKPLTCCGETMAKLCWGTGFNPLTRYIALRKFFTEVGFADEAKYCGQAFTLIQPVWQKTDLP